MIYIPQSKNLIAQIEKFQNDMIGYQGYIGYGKVLYIEGNIGTIKMPYFTIHYIKTVKL